MTTIEIEKAVLKLDKFNPRTNLVIPNYYIEFGTKTPHECDLFIVKKSGYAVEIEIKVSLSDIKADLKKKHSHINNRIKELYFAIPYDLYESSIDFIPKNAGIITVIGNSSYFYCDIKRSPKPNKSEKITNDEMIKIGRLCSMRLFNLKHN